MLSKLFRKHKTPDKAKMTTDVARVSGRTSSRKADKDEVPRQSIEADPIKLTRYYRRTLKEADLDAPDFKDGQEFVSVPYRAGCGRPSIEAGHLSPEDVEVLFSAYRNSHKRSCKNEDKAISVQISLATFYDSSAAHGAYHSLVVLPAKLAKDGMLTPDLDNWPWLNIKRLHRAGVPDEELMIGGDDALGRFWTFIDRDGEDLRSRGQEWKDCLKYARKMFEAVSGEKLNTWVKRKNDELHEARNTEVLETDSRVIADLCYVIQRDRVVASGGIQKLYQYLEEERAQHLPPLYASLLSTAARSRFLGSDKLADTIATRFTGTMNDEFPLTDTQRIAVRGFFADGEGDITAVSGPPGTGKTTMLQAIVASTLVNHALGKAEPPLIVGTSTNNQAVTNIIDSFASVSKDNPTVWEHRWIMKAPKDYDGKTELVEPLRSLAVYCPSGKKAKDAQKKGYLTEVRRSKSDTYALYSDSDYSEQALKWYIGFANDAFGEHFSDARQVEGALHRRIVSINENCNGLIESFEKYLDGSDTICEVRRHIRTLAQLHAFGASDEQASSNMDRLENLVSDARLQGRGEVLNSLDKLLDTTVRYSQFWLAVHYYEAQWVECEEDNSYLHGNELKKNTPGVMERYWRQATALTPCYVMTEYQIPQWMLLFTKEKGDHYDFGRIDLLIVDEAGQVDTCVGAAAFALAKRAVVVGDEKQLSPIWSMEPETDKQGAMGIDIGADAWNVLATRGLTCSEPSSIMRAASFASRWSYGPTKDGEILPGLFLAEHFRCHPLIINYCNELLYGGMLRPRRPMPAPVVKRLAELAAEGRPLEGNPEQSAQDDRRDNDGDCYRAYRLFGLVDNPLLFVTVKESKSQRAGSSRMNLAEAEAIASWIAENGSIFADIYGKDLKETIAVVTPFAAQARCISRELCKKIDSREARDIIVGTAHRLQGAERPVVLFSCVYGDDDQSADFIDGTPELMNVAVSRAKDLFVVFGSQARWKDRGPTFCLVHKLASKHDGRFIQLEEADSAQDSMLVPEKIDYESGSCCSKARNDSELSKAVLPSQERRYLKVPFEEKDAAKKLGVKWDEDERLWYATAETNSLVYDRWATYLRVPFKEKDAAKKLGAIWDTRYKRWYVPLDKDLKDFRRWW